VSGLPRDHFISRVHIRQWATQNQVTMLRRGGGEAQALDVGKAIAAESGLNDPVIEAAYGKIESAFSRALQRVMNRTGDLTVRNEQAIREYCVLMHDRYPALRGSATDERALPGGAAMMVPNPANWGASNDAGSVLDRLTRDLGREEVKMSRLRMLPTFARLLPAKMWIIRGGPTLLGDAGVHSITLHPEIDNGQTYVAMPLAPDATVIFGSVRPGDEDVDTIVRLTMMKVAMSSTVVIDSVSAPLISAFVQDMWLRQGEPAGKGVPFSTRVWGRPQDIPTS